MFKFTVGVKKKNKWPMKPSLSSAACMQWRILKDSMVAAATPEF